MKARLRPGRVAELGRLAGRAVHFVQVLLGPRENAEELPSADQTVFAAHVGDSAMDELAPGVASEAEESPVHAATDLAGARDQMPDGGAVDRIMRLIQTDAKIMGYESASKLEIDITLVTQSIQVVIDAVCQAIPEESIPAVMRAVESGMNDVQGMIARSQQALATSGGGTTSSLLKRN